MTKPELIAALKGIKERKGLSYTQIANTIKEAGHESSVETIRRRVIEWLNEDSNITLEHLIQLLNAMDGEVVKKIITLLNKTK